jgi:hypothetical protein
VILGRCLLSPVVFSCAEKPTFSTAASYVRGKTSQGTRELASLQQLQITCKFIIIYLWFSNDLYEHDFYVYGDMGKYETFTHIRSDSHCPVVQVGS